MQPTDYQWLHILKVLIADYAVLIDLNLDSSLGEKLQYPPSLVFQVSF